VTPRLLALIPSAVALNLAMGFIVNQLGLPVYLDSTGTVLVAALAGPGAGVLAGVVSQLVRSLYEGFVWLPFGLIQVLIAMMAVLAASRGGFKTLWRSAGWGTATGLVAGLLSALISYFIFKGVTATGVTAVTTLLAGLGLSREAAVTAASVGTDLVDKLLVFLLVGAALRGLPARMMSRYPLGAKATGVAP
jgi:energy-coupling factor transport system substrate-specific component